MSAEAYREEEMYMEDEPDVIGIRRNPYLVDYEQQRRLRGYGGQRTPQGEGGQRSFQRMQRRPQGGQEVRHEWEMEEAPRRMAQQGREMRGGTRRTIPQGQEMDRMPRRVSPQGRETDGVSRRTMPQGQEMNRMPRQMSRQDQEMGGESQRLMQRSREMEKASQRTVPQGQEIDRVFRRMPQQSRKADRVSQRMSQRELEIRRISQGEQERNRRAAMEKKRAALRRRRIVKMQRMALMVGIFSITLLCGILYLKRMDAKAVEPGHEDQQVKVTDGILPAATSLGMVQGLSATEFAQHPEWEENFLTPNEYSRPGEALEEVNSIFVHYTANPNTSAAQNRSYFEQLKDTHITSASAHFIIGYNGEIVQCIPLDEIAYAVQTRNYDSVSIECCYKSTDGSFTQETYDSLIELLAWLTDAYDLTTDDILRHYDCGGKKCPIYYAEHEDAWAKLKSDVAEKL
ncbi:MAG: N-acetylmuramoyl-L-alanine amidase [Blautia sp.]|nr:N-acetylmuramoyl-L-alanine amidase [Blautia sp.]